MYKRLLQNVEALLAEGGCTMADMAHLLIYLRDPADAPVVSAMFEQRFPQLPHIVLHAPVCRPAWLIEVECIAIKI
ncbi:MAG: hypothetical protein K2N10_03390 [Muribaculaceae bacterium]|nr:hypothetical protein [Muribaculaceae bacterium]